MKFSHWKKDGITRPDGTEVEAIFPVIISASRATDIPAFHAEWFFDRLRTGYTKWINRFNANQVQYVAFRDTRVVVFWSKNPEPILPYLNELDRRGIHYYFQFTLNDYDAEWFEPGLPLLKQRIETFRRVADRVGPDRVIWRFDPLVLTETLTVPTLLERVERVGEQLTDFTRKLVFSYADIACYRGVRANLKRLGVPWVEFTPETMREFAEGLVGLNTSWRLQLATCAEEIDLTQWGIVHNRCIDDELMIRLWPEDAALMRFLGHEADLFGAQDARHLKDPGQRPLCGCVPSKDIGRYNTCPHQCVYCYANR